MKLSIDPQRHMSTLFPTQVGRVLVPNASRINPGLESAIMQRHAEDPGVIHSNIGGWQSKGDFPEWPEWEVIDLLDSFRSGVINMIRLTSGIDKFDVSMHLSAWANVSRKGHFNQVHTHPENAWSGVYYVKSGVYDQDVIHNPGQLHFHEPRERIEMTVYPGGNFGKPVPCPPRDGLLLLFPSWLGHSVNTFYSDTLRISVAFNAQLLHFRKQ